MMRLELPPTAIVLETAMLELLPDDQKAWVRATLLTTGRGLVVLADETTTTAAGWPLRIVEAEVDLGDRVEHRVAAFYALFEHAATVVARDARAVLPELREVLRAAVPRWTDDVVALAEVWDVRAQ
jgi:hypothetical protein